jgi:hypothetical protein
VFKKHNRKLFRGFGFRPGEHPQLFIAGYDGVVQVYDTQTWQEIHSIDFAIGKLWSLVLAPDGLSAVVVGRSRKSFLRWDLWD